MNLRRMGSFLIQLPFAVVPAVIWTAPSRRADLAPLLRKIESDNRHGAELLSDHVRDDAFEVAAFVIGLAPGATMPPDPSYQSLQDASGHAQDHPLPVLQS
jgi:hypothetical protein